LVGWCSRIRELVCRLLSNRRETPTTRVIRVGLEGQPFEYEAGQAAWLGNDPHGELTPYSIASAPEETRQHGWLEFLVKVDAARHFGAIVSTLRRSRRIIVAGPAGTFTFPRRLSHQRLLFVAGGTGIAPVRSMIVHAIRKELKASVTLLYSARNADEFAYLPELRRFARQGALQLELTLTGPHGPWRYGRGRAGSAHLQRLAADEPTLCFLCGPPAMVDDLSAALVSLGVPAADIRREQY
jgi:NAD(P)H-flavin reductase